MRTEVNSFLNKDIDIWKIFYWMLIIGLLLGIVFQTQTIIWESSFAVNVARYLSSVGTLLFVAGACFSAGGLSGFLFGVPRMFNNPVGFSEENSGGSSDKKRKRVVSQNDNLVQISDWLTKIIVGVGLTQLHNIPGFLHRTGVYLSASFSAVPELGRNIAIVTILYFTIVGFLSVYMWTRVYFTKMVNQLEVDLDDQVRTEIENIKEGLNTLQEASADAGGGKNITREELISKSRNALKVQQPSEHPDDPQKGKWGGVAERNGRKLYALITTSQYEGFYIVTLVVKSIDASRPLTGLVKFHLHNTFRNPDPVIAVQNGEAILKLSKVYGAFTVGAEADDGTTKLELDLAELSGAPADFKSR